MSQVIQVFGDVSKVMSLEVDTKAFPAKETLMTCKDLVLHLESLLIEKLVKCQLLSKEFVSLTTVEFVHLDQCRTLQEALASKDLIKFKTVINGKCTSTEAALKEAMEKLETGFTWCFSYSFIHPLD